MNFKTFVSWNFNLKKIMILFGFSHFYLSGFCLSNVNISWKSVILWGEDEGSKVPTVVQIMWFRNFLNFLKNQHEVRPGDWIKLVSWMWINPIGGLHTRAPIY